MRSLSPFLRLGDYQRLLGTLGPGRLPPGSTRAWGAPEDDPAIRDGHFTLRFAATASLSPRSSPTAAMRSTARRAITIPTSRRATPMSPSISGCARSSRHPRADPSRHPRHAGMAAGQGVALSRACLPAALLGGLPVIYPFIVNNPGEAAAAKRRLGAVTIGHLTPPLKPAGHGPRASSSSGSSMSLPRPTGSTGAAPRCCAARSSTRAEAAGLLGESGAGPRHERGRPARAPRRLSLRREGLADQGRLCTSSVVRRMPTAAPNSCKRWHSPIPACRSPRSPHASTVRLSSSAMRSSPRSTASS